MKSALLIGVLVALLGGGCVISIPVPTPAPTPIPTPTPTPIPIPIPTPTPGWFPPPPLGLIIAGNAGVNRPVIDATPKTKNTPEWCMQWSTGGQNCPGGSEDTPGQRSQVETIWGPYIWTIDGSACIPSGACWLDGDNPLRLVAPGAYGKTIRVTGGNGVFVDTIPVR